MSVHSNIEPIDYSQPEAFIRSLHERLSITSILDIGSGHSGPFDCDYWTNRPMFKRVAIDIDFVRELPQPWVVINGLDALNVLIHCGLKSFDYVQCMEMIEHVEREHHPRLLAQMCKVARKLVVVTSADEDQHTGPAHAQAVELNPHQKYLGQPQPEILKEAGFQLRVALPARRQLIAWRYMGITDGLI